MFVFAFALRLRLSFMQSDGSWCLTFYEDSAKFPIFYEFSAFGQQQHSHCICICIMNFMHFRPSLSTFIHIHPVSSRGFCLDQFQITIKHFWTLKPISGTELLSQKGQMGWIGWQCRWLHVRRILKVGLTAELWNLNWVLSPKLNPCHYSKLWIMNCWASRSL